MVQDYFQPFGSTESPGGSSGGGFTDWWNKLDGDKRKSLTTGLMSAGLGIMAAGGRAYDRPVSGLGVIGEGGMQGLNTYQRTLEQERRDDARQAGLQISKGYQDITKERAGREAEVFEAEKPYLGERAKIENEISGLRLGLLKNPPEPEYTLGPDEVRYKGVKPVAFGKPKEATTKDKTFERSRGQVSDIVKYFSPDLGSTMLTASPERMLALLNDPQTQSKIRKVEEELKKTGNEKNKQLWDAAWNNIYSTFGVPNEPVVAQKEWLKYDK